MCLPHLYVDHEMFIEGRRESDECSQRKETWQQMNSMLSMIDICVFYSLQEESLHSSLCVFSFCYCLPPVAATRFFPKYQVDSSHQSKYDNKLWEGSETRVSWRQSMWSRISFLPCIEGSITQSWYLKSLLMMFLSFSLSVLFVYAFLSPNCRDIEIKPLYNNCSQYRLLAF